MALVESIGASAPRIARDRYLPDDFLTALGYLALVRRFTRLRSLVHRRHLRAAAVGLSLAAIACSGGALGLRLEHDVSFLAVVRYFSRPRLDEDDITRWLRQRATGQRLEKLLDSPDASVFGGLVYAHRDQLVFHPRRDPALGEAWRTEWENRALYARLVPLYHRAEVHELVAQLSSQEIGDALVERGVDLSGLGELSTRLASMRTLEDETRLRRRAAHFILPFTPNPVSPSWLDFGERLRFYESSSPPGRFVGQFAVLDPGWGGGLDQAEALELGRRNHYLLITRTAGRILVLDFHRDRVRRYDLRPFNHRAGNRLYHLTVAG